MSAEKNAANATPKASTYVQKDSNSKDSETDNEADNRFGYCGYRPDWMQVFNNPKFLCVLLSAFAFAQSFVVNGVNNVNITSYEKRFGFPSTQAGIISSGYDISAGILALPITYYALTGHRHRILAVTIVLMGVGSLLMWLPHFTTGLYQGRPGSTAMCLEEVVNSTAFAEESSSTDLSYYLYILIAGQLLHGIGGTTIYSVGISCMDDCVPTKSSPVYASIIYSFSALGPAAGYVLGGYLLDIYVDFNVVSSTALSPSDPSWVGAWWIGFIIAMSLAWIMSIPLFGLPRELPGTKAVRAGKVSEAHQQGSNEKLVEVKLKEFPRVLLILLKNPTFMLITMSSVTEGLAFSAFATFIPKFIENQYGQTAGFSAILTGLMAVPGGAGGYLLGGFLCRKLKLKIRGILRYCAVVSFLSILTVTCMWLQCEKANTAGLSVTYNDSSVVPSSPNLIDQCNSDCGCTQESYTPVCGANGIQYFSPCHAGCSEKSGENYHSCACVNATGMSYNQTTVNGVCETSCPLLYVFLPLFFLLILLTFLAATPAAMGTLRCVPMKYKTFAIGVQWVFGRFLGTVPGPILFGVIIDSVCVIWKRSGENLESCWIYDGSTMSRNFFLFGFGFKCLTLTCFIVGSFVYKAPSSETAAEFSNVCEGSNSKNPVVTLSLKQTSDLQNRGSEEKGIDNPALEL